MVRKFIAYGVILLFLFLLGTVPALPQVPSYPSTETPYLSLVNLAPLHQLGLNGSGVTVAVLDSGLNSSSLAFRGSKVVAWYDFVANKSVPYDDLGHGTAVTSLIAGKPLDYKLKDGTLQPAFFGIADGVALVVGKVVDSNGSIKNCDTVGTAIHWAVNAGASIINLSLYCRGVTDGKSAIDQAVDWAATRGVLVVTIAGNFGNATSSLTQPGDAMGGLTVGAVDFTGSKAQPYSGVGPTQDGRVEPGIVAPSGRMNSTSGGIVAISRNGLIYSNWWGTSFAAPIVVGIAALLKEWNPHLNGTAIKRIIESTATTEGVPVPNNTFGYGLIDAERAFAAISGQTPQSLIILRGLEVGLTYFLFGIVTILVAEGVIHVVRWARTGGIPGGGAMNPMLGKHFYQNPITSA